MTELIISPKPCKLDNFTYDENLLRFNDSIKKLNRAAKCETKHLTF